MGAKMSFSGVYSNGLFSNAPPSPYATLAAPAVVPAAPSASAPAPVYVPTGSTPAPAATYQNAGIAPAGGGSIKFPTMENDAADLIAQNAGQGGPLSKGGGNNVIYATMGVYGAFLTAVAGLLTVFALGSNRGRLAEFSYGTAENLKERMTRKTEVAKSEIERFKTTTGLKPTAYNRTPAAAPKEQGHASTGEDNLYLPDADARERNFLSTDPKVIEHQGWWTKAHDGAAGGKKGMLFLGHLGNGASLGDRVVKSKYGEIVIAHEVGKGSSLSKHTDRDLQAELVKHDVSGAENASVLKNFKPHDEYTWAVDNLRGPRMLRVYRAELGSDAGANMRMLAGVEKFFGIDHKALVKQLADGKRVAADVAADAKNVFAPLSWETQYELQRGTPFATSESTAKRGVGQMGQRLKEFGTAIKNGLNKPAEAGDRFALMLMSSVCINAILTGLTATVANCVNQAQAKQKSSTS